MGIPALVFWAAVFEISVLLRLLERCIYQSSLRPRLLFLLLPFSAKGWPRRPPKRLRTCLQLLQEHPPRRILSRMPPAHRPAGDVYVPWPDALAVAALIRGFLVRSAILCPGRESVVSAWRLVCAIAGNILVGPRIVGDPKVRGHANFNQRRLLCGLRPLGAFQNHFFQTRVQICHQERWAHPVGWTRQPRRRGHD